MTTAHKNKVRAWANVHEKYGFMGAVETKSEAIFWQRKVGGKIIFCEITYKIR